MQRTRQGVPSERISPRLWIISAGASLLAAALWLRAPSLRYLATTGVATGVSVAVAVLLPRPRRWAVLAAVALATLSVVAAIAQRNLIRVDRDWPAHREHLLRAGSARLGAGIADAKRSLGRTARRALRTPSDTEDGFRFIEKLIEPGADRGVVLYRDGYPVAWAGQIRLPLDSVGAPLGVVRSPFYLVMHAVAIEETMRAVTTIVVHAEPPADRLARTLGSDAARRTGLEGFEIVSAGDSVMPGDIALNAATRGDTSMRLRPVAPLRGEANLRTLQKIRLRGALLLSVAVIFFIVAAWQRMRSLGARGATLGIALACVAIVPLNTFSSLSPLFSSAFYFAEFGGPFTASVGALTLSSALVLLALLTILRAHVRVPSRRAALVIVLVLMGGGPFLLRDLARGISVPPGGVMLDLWLAWQVALFLAGACLLVGAAAAGSTALGGSRGLPPVLAPVLAALAALIGPLVWQAPGRWPGWYPMLWIAAIGALALTRRHRTLLLTAASVAAFGSATLTWGASVRGRVFLANADVEGLQGTEPDRIVLLQRLGNLLIASPPPESEADLLRTYVRSDLAGSGYPIEMAGWRTDGSPAAELAFSPARARPEDVAAVVREARDSGSRVLRAVPAMPGAQHILALPYSDGMVTTVTVHPRTRLIPDDPFNSLLGIEPREKGEPPYSISITEVSSSATEASSSADAPPAAARWYRAGNEMHGDRVISSPRGLLRAHIEVELRSLDILIQRGTLVVLLDLVLILGLWVLSVVPGGAFGHWLRSRRRRWARSYRARLTLALFAFFVMPAMVFALWSYRRLQAEDRASRELLVREKLRAVASEEESQPLDSLGKRLETPLFLFREGTLRRASQSLHDALAPLGHFLPREIHELIALGGELDASRLAEIGGVPTLMGYRAAASQAGERIVFAAPAPSNEEALDRRRRDLGVLVLFATVVGAFGALWLSGFAARSLAEPIGRLRSAALAIAGGEREPLLTGVPPEEFVPVFSAFRRMAADLGESRAALEEAQRRTAAVLRNVASGVIAVDRNCMVTLTNPRADALLQLAVPLGTVLERCGAPELVEPIRSFLDGSHEEQELDLPIGGRQMHIRLVRLKRGEGGAVVTLDDLTELARAQRVLAWGEMARQVAHEIKNPLTPIRLGIQHLMRARNDSRADFDQILDRNATRIMAEIDRLDEIARSFSRYGTMPAERLPAEPTDVAAVMRDVVELERLGRDDTEWSISGAGKSLHAHARYDELREVLLNLLENARLAGARHVEARLSSTDGSVIIEVADDGHGIASAVLPRIFEPHFSTRTSGSGLGLAISRRLIESWGGEIAISSRQGNGATVRIVLEGVAS